MKLIRETHEIGNGLQITTKTWLWIHLEFSLMLFSMLSINECRVDPEVGIFIIHQINFGIKRTV